MTDPTTPDIMPILSYGAHDNPAKGACLMEYASLLAGEAWSDSPACTHPVLASAARRVNDSLADDERQQLLPLLPRLMGTTPTGTPAEQHRLSVALAVWCAEQVVHLAGKSEPVSRKAVHTVRAWLDGEATRQDCRAAASVARTADVSSSSAAAAAAHAAVAADVAADVASSAADFAVAYAYVVVAYAYVAVDVAADVASSAAADQRIALLVGLIDEHDRLTGRAQPAPLAEADLSTLAEATR